MKRQYIEGIFIFLIVFLLIFCSWMVFYLIDQKTKCLANPFIYAANSIKGNVSCVCYEYNNFGMFPLYFNKTHQWAEYVKIKNDFYFPK